MILIDGCNNNTRETGISKVIEFNPNSRDYDIAIPTLIHRNVLFCDTLKKHLIMRYEKQMIGVVAFEELNILISKYFNALAYNDELFAINAENMEEQIHMFKLLLSNYNFQNLNPDKLKNGDNNSQWNNKYLKSLKQLTANLSEIHKFRHPHLYQWNDVHGENKLHAVTFSNIYGSIVCVNTFKPVSFTEMKFVLTSIKQMSYAQDNVLLMADKRIMSDEASETFTFERYTQFINHYTNGSCPAIIKKIYDPSTLKNSVEKTRGRLLRGSEFLELYADQMFVNEKEKSYDYIYPVISDLNISNLN